MSVYKFSVSEKRALRLVIAGNKIDAVLETNLAFTLHCESDSKLDHYDIKFLHYRTSAGSAAFENQDMEADTPFARSLEAFKDVAFEVSRVGKKIKIIKGYKEFANRIDKLFFLYQDNEKDEPPSNTFTEGFFEKIFEKFLYQLPIEASDINSSWRERKEIDLLDEIIAFETVAKITGVQKDILEIKSAGAFVRDVYSMAGQKVTVKGNYKSNILYDKGISMPGETKSILKMEGKGDSTKLNGLIVVTDTYVLKSSPVYNDTKL